MLGSDPQYTPTGPHLDFAQDNVLHGMCECEDPDRPMVRQVTLSQGKASW